MEVLKRGNEIKHRINCLTCRSELEITTDDIIQADAAEKYSTKGYVVCPVCGNKVKTYEGQFKATRYIVKDEETSSLIRV